MIETACQLREPLFGFGVVFLFFCAGILLMPGKRVAQADKFRRDWNDVRRKAVASKVSAPLYLFFGIPVVGLICLPVLAPTAAWVLGIGTLFLPQLICS
ncbi:MAG: hypothetical protein E6R10_10360 [Rhodocyclaceae bacterium]|nr:MAG: hypothetical protein E6R10_10360 [Rhodocyclaceae bacterium]